LCRRFFFGSAFEAILSSVQRQHFQNRGQFLKIEDKMNLSGNRGQISKIEDSPLKNQADGQPTYDVHYLGGEWWSGAA